MPKSSLRGCRQDMLMRQRPLPKIYLEGQDSVSWEVVELGASHWMSVKCNFSNIQDRHKPGSSLEFKWSPKCWCQTFLTKVELVCMLFQATTPYHNKNQVQIPSNLPNSCVFCHRQLFWQARCWCLLICPSAVPYKIWDSLQLSNCCYK